MSGVAWRLLCALWLAAAAAVSPALARDHFVAPQGAVPAEAVDQSDGTAEAPFPSVQHALGSGAVSPGDRLILQDGHHGTLRLVNQYFDPPLHIEAETPGRAHVTRIGIRGGRGLTFSGLAVWPLEQIDHIRLISTAHGADHMRFYNMDVRGRGDALESYMDWEAEDWLTTWRHSGVRLAGDHNAIIGSRITATAFGITTMGSHAEVRGNIIEGFSGDAMRGLGHHSVFTDNRVANCFKVDDNHDDGFQSWARAARSDGREEVVDIRVENNVILEWVGPANHPLRCVLQGIGLFDGHYRNFTIRNNLIAVSAWHGIAIYAGIDSQIVNNTVVHISGGASAERPWIGLFASRDNVEVINNVAVTYRGIEAPSRMNTTARFPARLFRDPAALDFRPRADSPLVDAGSGVDAPEVDLLHRPRDARPDLGAFELE